MKKKIKLIPILIAIFLLTVVSGGVYAYWAASVKGTNNNSTAEVEVGEAGEVLTTLTINGANSDKIIVPKGKEVENVSVSKITPEFTLVWNGVGAEGTEGIVAATLVSVKADDYDITHLFTIGSLSSNQIFVGTSKTVSLDIEFTNEPVDATEYVKVAGKQIIVTISFSITL